MKLKDTNNGKIRALLQQGPKSTEELLLSTRLDHSSILMALRSLKRRDQIRGSHAQWRIADWCDTEEKFYASVSSRWMAGLKSKRVKRASGEAQEEEARAAAITRGVNTAILSWRAAGEYESNPAHS